MFFFVPNISQILHIRIECRSELVGSYKLLVLRNVTRILLGIRLNKISFRNKWTIKLRRHIATKVTKSVKLFFQAQQSSKHSKDTTYIELLKQCQCHFKFNILNTLVCCLIYSTAMFAWISFYKFHVNKCHFFSSWRRNFILILSYYKDRTNWHKVHAYKK